MKLSKNIDILNSCKDTQYFKSMRNNYFRNINLKQNGVKQLSEGTLCTSCFWEIIYLNKELLSSLIFIVDDDVILRIDSNITQNEYHNLWVAYHDFGHDRFRTQINGRWVNKYSLLGTCTTIEIFNVEGTFRYLYEHDTPDLLRTVLSLEYQNNLKFLE